MIVNIALLTVTDTRTFDNDKSGTILVDKIKEANHKLIDRRICKDNKDDIVLILKEWTNQKEIDVIITTGGTGLTGRDITPEAVNEIADKLDVSKEEVVSMNRRLSGKEFSLNAQVGEDGDEWQDWLVDKELDHDLKFAHQEEMEQRKDLSLIHI